MAAVEEFDPFRVRPLPNQPRKRFAGVVELAASIKEIGQAMPGLVTRVKGDPDFDAQLIDGERRLRACRNLGCKVRAEIREAKGDDETFSLSFAANFGKQDHDPIEICEGLRRMQASGKTIQQLSAIAGKSTCWVSQYVSLAKLHPDCQRMMIEPAPGQDDPPLSFQLALLLVPLPHARQLQLLKKICSGISVVEAQRLIYRERREAGDARAGLGSGKNRRTLEALADSIADFGNRLGIYVDMPFAVLGQVIDGSDAKERRDTIEAIDEVMSSLQGLSESIKRRLPALRKRA